MPLSFAAVGELMLDVEIRRGADAHAGQIAVRVGGTAANAAVWAVAAGAEAICVGRVGADAAGAAIRESLLAHGVRPCLVVDRRRPTGSVAVIDGELVVDRGANAALESTQVDTDVVLVSGYSLLSEEGGAVAATLATSSAAWTVATGGSAGLLSAGRERFLERTQGVRVVVATAGEAAVLTGHTDPAAAARELAGAYEVACVTLGAAGAVLASGDDLHADEGRAAAVVSPVRGSGDALAATLVVALAQGESLAAALARGCRAGTSSARSPTGWPGDVR